MNSAHEENSYMLNMCEDKFPFLGANDNRK